MAIDKIKMAAEDRRREKKINLAALKKLDKFAANILDTASSVAHYIFDAKSEEWVRYAILLLIKVEDFKFQADVKNPLFPIWCRDRPQQICGVQKF